MPNQRLNLKLKIGGAEVREGHVGVHCTAFFALADQVEEQDMKVETLVCVLQSSGGANCHESRSFLVTKSD